MKLLKRLFQGGSTAASPSESETAEIPVLDPHGGPVYVVGDVHGCLRDYCALELAILEDAANFEGVFTIVLLGDVVDRGPDTAALIDHLLMRQREGMRLICLTGNHEEMMLNFAISPKANLNWLTSGGYETLVSYGLTRDLEDLLQMNDRNLSQIFSAHVSNIHLKFLRASLPGLHLDQFLLAHAGADQDAPLTKQPNLALVWGSLGQVAPNGLTLVHGHYIVSKPRVLASSIAIDTGAYATGHLTCLRLLRGQRMSLMTTKQDNMFKEI